MAYSFKWLRLFFTSSKFSFSESIFESCLFLSNFVIFLILISVSLIISSSDTSLRKILICGLIFEDITFNTDSQLSQFSISRYILLWMNIFSRLSKCHFSSILFFSRVSSALKTDNAWLTDSLSKSLTFKNWGFSSLMTQQLGETDISQFVNP